MVSGQAKAEAISLNNVGSFPTEIQMAAKVLPLPKANKGKYLINQDEKKDNNLQSLIAPCLEPGYVIRLSIERGGGGKSKWLGRSDVFSILERSNAGEEVVPPRGGGAHIVQETNTWGRKKFLWKDENEKPLALAVQEKMKINKAYFIYGTTPMFEGESPAKEENGVAFYNMYKVRDIDDRNLDYRVLQIWNGNNYEPYFRVHPAPRFSGFSKIVGSTVQLVPPRKDDNLVVDPQNPGNCHAVLSKKQGGKGWDLVIAPGADTGVLLMLAAVMDDMVGWFA